MFGWSIQDITMGFAVILMVGVFAQWLAWRLRCPSIVALMACGVLLGPVGGWIEPDALFGEGVVRSIVAVGVAVILFEGGLSLRFRELAGNHVVWRLVLVGVVVTMGFSAVLARIFFDLSWPIAALWGAVLAVTGPTVIVPLLRHLRLTDNVGVTLKWEGILNDPVGAIIAVLIYEAIVLTPMHGSAVGDLVWGLASAALLGVGIGVLGGLSVVPLFHKFWVPDYLRSPVTLGVVLGVFEAANVVREESGLLAVTVMGVFLANQPWVQVKRIAQFKETLSLVLIGFLFVLLSARVTMQDIRGLGLNAALFLAALIFVVRPLAVGLATLGSSLNFKQRFFLAAISPRGIVAAAVVSAFAVDSGSEEIHALVPLTFFVIAGTVTVSGLTAPWLARAVGLSKGTLNGVLLLGGARWVRHLAETLTTAEIPVRLVDDNWFAVHRARMDGIPAQHVNIMMPDAVDEIDRTGMGMVWALESHDERNVLFLNRLEEVFDRSELFMLGPEDAKPTLGARKPDILGRDLGARVLFAPGMNFAEINSRFRAGWRFKVTSLSEQFDAEDLVREHGPGTVILFWIVGGVLHPSEGQEDVPREADRVLAFVPPDENAPEAGGKRHA